MFGINMWAAFFGILILISIYSWSTDINSMSAWSLNRKKFHHHPIASPEGHPCLQKEIYGQITNYQYIYNDKLDEEFDIRRGRISTGCPCLSKIGFLTHHWTYQPIGRDKGPRWNKYYIDKRKNYTICIVPKVGSSSWREYIKKSKMMDIVPVDNINIITVRHPLARLVSSYSDKYLGGAALLSYNARERKEQMGSVWDGSWKLMWYRYWLPALISTGHVEATQAFMEDINTARHSGDRFIVIEHIIEKHYKHEYQYLIERFSNHSFSFTDFIAHVLWSYDIGIGNHHWVPQAILCNVCNTNDNDDNDNDNDNTEYNYIIKLENMEKEITYVTKYLGFGDMDFKTYRVTGNKTNELQIYNEISDYAMKRIIDLYILDFELFGYEF